MASQPDNDNDFEGGFPARPPALACGYCSTIARRKEGNEDRVFCHPQNHAFGVFDGHAGKRCSQYMVDNFPQHLADRARPGLQEVEAKQLLTGAFRHTDNAFCTQAVSQGWKDGSTGCVAIVAGMDLFVANVGDSSAHVFRCVEPGEIFKSGSNVAMSSPHKASDPVEIARIKAAGGEVPNVEGTYRVGGCIAMSRALGNAQLKKWLIPEADVKSRKLIPGDDFLVIGSDGMFDICKRASNFAKVAKILKAAPDCKAAAHQLAAYAVKQGSYDNVCVVVVDLRSLFPPPVGGTSDGGGGGGG
mmetsp:Transcript_15834/g.38202  ORF Transcript_15834/g.38202 Transcript_15834/m.38202 type:complete len:302 (+) Transcript_15834:317-1222(+)